MDGSARRHFGNLTRPRELRGASSSNFDRSGQHVSNDIVQTISQLTFENRRFFWDKRSDLSFTHQRNPRSDSNVELIVTGLVKRPAR
jgi:hypothetical protein